eukprot:1192797-Prorocentrum_minimum.AAC.2
MDVHMKAAPAHKVLDNWNAAKGVTIMKKRINDYQSARKKALEVLVRALIEAGADMKQATSDGRTPGNVAADNGHTEVRQQQAEMVTWEHSCVDAILPDSSSLMRYTLQERVMALLSKYIINAQASRACPK